MKIFLELLFTMFIIGALAKMFIHNVPIEKKLIEKPRIVSSFNNMKMCS